MSARGRSKQARARQTTAGRPNRRILKRTIEAAGLPRLDHHPGDGAARGQREKVRRGVLIPAAGELLLAFPLRRHLGKDGGDARVLDPVGDHAALGNRAETVEVLAGNQQVSRRQSKDRIPRRVVADPLKCLQPRIGRGVAGQFQMAALGIEVAIDRVHSNADGHKQ